MNHQGELQEAIKSIERSEWEQNVKWDKYMEFCQQADKSLADMQSTSNYDRVIELTQDKTNRVKDSISEKEELFKSYMGEIDLFNYLTWVYSRGGVVNLIIQKCFMRLKALTNFYLKKVCSEGFKLEIAPQRALKSGEYREEVDIFIWQGSRRIPYASLSSGQQQRINMAMLVSLFQFGREIGANNFDFLLLDEIVDLSLAEAGQEAALDLLYDLKPNIFHIIIISHKEGLKGRFDKEIQVIRGEDEVSKIV
jgi:DNA repair exonuclease SbcCD ATPase subunit